MRGFTLVEIVVSMSIVVLMLGVGVPAFQRFGAQVELDQAAVEVQAAIFEARNLALSPEASKKREIDNYGMMFHTDGINPEANQYSVVRIDTENADQLTLPFSANNEFVVKTRTLPRGLSFLSIPDHLWYSISGQGKIDFLGPSPVITRTNSNPPVIKELEVNEITGQVTVVKDE